MNKIIIGLLLVAAGAGVYFLFLQKKPASNNPAFKKEALTGSWKTGTGSDSVFTADQIEFTADGRLIKKITVTDTMNGVEPSYVKADTLYYSWTKENGLTVKKNAADTTGTVFSVKQLKGDTLQLESAAKTISQFIRSVKDSAAAPQPVTAKDSLPVK